MVSRHEARRMPHQKDRNGSTPVGLSQPVEFSRRSSLTGLARFAVPTVALTVVLASLFGALDGAGIWDPYELRVAELARRIAVNSFSADWLAIDGADNSMVDLGDLRSGELPFTSVAVGFTLFGLGEWAGRLPLAVWGLLGVLAIGAAVARLVDRVAAAFAMVVLATMPLYFVQARTMLGDGVTMASVAIAFGGLVVGVFDGVGRDRPRRWPRVVAVLVGLGGLVAGYLCRGPLFGVAVPTGGIAIGWALWHHHRGRLDRLGDAIGAGCVLLGLLAAAVGVVALHGAFADPARFRLLVGVPLVARSTLPTFDAVMRALGHGLFPYSGLLPLALGRMALEPAADDEAAARESALRIALVSFFAIALLTTGLLMTWTETVPFVAVSAAAALVALALRDIDRGAPASAGLALGTVALTILVAWDFKTFPVETFTPFGVTPAQFPNGLDGLLEHLVEPMALGLGAIAFVALIERGGTTGLRFRRERYLAWPRTLWSGHHGNILFAALVVEAALVGLAVLTWLSNQFFHWRQLAGMSSNARGAATMGWVVFPALLLLAPLLALLLRDVAREVFARVAERRAGAVLVAFVVAALVLSLGYYPALARQLSPRSVFVAFSEHAKPGEQLGLLGVGERSASYYAGGGATVLATPQAAFEWLGSGESRRWLVTRSDSLPELNSLYRAAHPGHNAPVFDGRSSEILLVVSALRPGEVNANPLADVVIEGKVAPAHPMDANLGGRLDALGWEVIGSDGAPTDELVPGGSYQFRIYWKVIRRVSAEWETFIHIDGHGQRHNGDHQTVGGRYPLRFWLPGDVIRDSHEFALEPNFAPGQYDVYFGLFMGSRRLEVQRGKHEDDRLFGGKIRVR